MMDIKQLRSLIAVEDHGSFSAAADALDTVQSNVSSHISKLENEINAVLVDRRAGTLTEQGEIVSRRARSALEEMESIFSDLSSLETDVKGRVRVGIIGTTARWLIPIISDVMSTSHPMLRAEYLEATSSSLVRWLHDEVIDIAVLNAPIVGTEVTFRALFEEVLVLTVPRDSPLATLPSVSVRELEGLELIAPPKGNWFRSELDAVAAKHRIRITTRLEIDGLRLIAALSADGFGSAIVPATAISPTMTKDIAAIPINDLAGRKVGLARRRNKIESSATKAFVLVVEEVFKAHRTKLPSGVSTRI